MATKKQQRRRYERAVGRGRQYDMGERETRPSRDQGSPARRGSRSALRGRREVQPPSFTRAGRRAVLFAVLWFVVVSVLPLGSSRPLAVNAAFAGVVFIMLWPVGYASDAIIWRMVKKRQQQAGS